MLKQYQNLINYYRKIIKKKIGGLKERGIKKKSWKVIMWMK